MLDELLDPEIRAALAGMPELVFAEDTLQTMRQLTAFEPSCVPNGIDPQRIGVGGRSAGGGLAAALALRFRDRGKDRIAFQYLEYPMLDDRQRTLSSRLDGLPLWSRESNAYAWSSYLAGLHGADDLPADAAPARASDLAGLPTTFVNVGTADGFRDEVIDFAARLTRAGVMTELHVYAGAVHGFHLFAGSAVVRCAVLDSESWLRRQLTVPQGGAAVLRTG
jgi:acetyl esterase/lipase